jgi:hypothetical protein
MLGRVRFALSNASLVATKLPPRDSTTADLNPAPSMPQYPGLAEITGTYQGSKGPYSNPRIGEGFRSQKEL